MLLWSGLCGACNCISSRQTTRRISGTGPRALRNDTETQFCSAVPHVTSDLCTSLRPYVTDYFLHIALSIFVKFKHFTRVLALRQINGNGPDGRTQFRFPEISNISSSRIFKALGTKTPRLKCEKCRCELKIVIPPLFV